MAIDMFLILQSPAVPSTPVTGEPTMDAYYKTFAPNTAVEIRSFSLGVENITTIGSTTGGMGAGKIKLKEAYIEKSVDLLTPSLYKVSASGAHFDKMQLFIRKAGGAAPVPRPYLMYGFSIV